MPEDDAYPVLASRFPEREGARSVVRVDLRRISDSCGFGVPLMRHEGDRPQLADWAVRKGPSGIAAYQEEKNAESIDGLPGVTKQA